MARTWRSVSPSQITKESGVSVWSRTSMTTESHAFFSLAAPRSRRASCSGVKPLAPLATNSSIIPINVMRRDVALDRSRHLAGHRFSGRNGAAQLAARDFRRAHMTQGQALWGQADGLELGWRWLRYAAVHYRDRG